VTSKLPSISNLTYLPDIGDFADFSEPSAVLAFIGFIAAALSFPGLFANSPDIFCAVGAGLPFSSAPEPVLTGVPP
jgi:hypothetical protein